MKSLLKAIDTIDAVARAGSVGIRELSSMTGFPPSTIHRIVAALMAKQYLRQDPFTRRYSLSFRFLELGSQVQQQSNLVTIARPHLERLMAEAKESVNLAVQDADSVVYLDCVQSNYSMLQLFTKPGARVPLYATAVGKMFLSRMSESELNAYLERTQLTLNTPYTRIERSNIIEDLKQVRLQGYSVDDEEMEEGVRCVAALIYDYNGQPAAAISISGAAMRVTPARVSYYGELTSNCALAISRELGFHQGPQQPASEN
jgi:DNA-binding IclR family transcriptional regulator